MKVKKPLKSHLKQYRKLSKLGGQSVVSAIKKVNPANNNKYFKVSKALQPLLNKQRYIAIQNFDTCKQHTATAKQYCTELWTAYLQERLKNQNVMADGDYSIHSSMLTKNENVPDIIAKRILENLENQFDISDELPLILGDGLISSLLKAPKQVIGQMKLNGVGKHSRPCYIIRQLLTCEIHDKKYMLTLDSKYYQNSPTVAFQLNFLANGQTNGVCQLARIDSVGHLGPDFLKENGINDVKIPDYLVEKINCIHNNSIPSKNKKSSYRREQVPGGNHMHIRSEAYELLFALSHMAKTCTFRTKPNEFLKYNAKGISDESFYDKSIKSNSSYNIDGFSNYLKTKAKVDKLKLLDAKNNAGVIRTDLLSSYAYDAFNVENNNLTENFANKMDKIRTYDPDRLCTILNFENVNKADVNENVVNLNQKYSNKLLLKAQSIVGRKVDIDSAIYRNKKSEIVEEITPPATNNLEFNKQ